jgi:DNA polymerase-3 subunit beta
VKLALQNGRLELQASAPELGEAHESLAADYKGEPVEIGFNAQYLLDFLAAAGSEAVTLDVKDAESQGMLKPKGESETDYRYVVMPMRL